MAVELRPVDLAVEAGIDLYRGSLDVFMNSRIPGLNEAMRASFLNEGIALSVEGSLAGGEYDGVLPTLFGQVNTTFGYTPENLQDLYFDANRVYIKGFFGRTSGKGSLATTSGVYLELGDSTTGPVLKFGDAWTKPQPINPQALEEVSAFLDSLRSNPDFQIKATPVQT